MAHLFAFTDKIYINCSRMTCQDISSYVKKLNYVNMNVYDDIMSQLPITNIGRAYVVILFTLHFLRRRPFLCLAVSRYWCRRLWYKIKVMWYSNIHDSEENIEEEETQEKQYTSRKRRREDDTGILPDMKRQVLPLQYHNPVMSQEQLQQFQEVSARQYIPM